MFMIFVVFSNMEYLYNCSDFRVMDRCLLCQDTGTSESLPALESSYQGIWFFHMLRIYWFKLFLPSHGMGMDNSFCADQAGRKTIEVTLEAPWRKVLKISRERPLTAVRVLCPEMIFKCTCCRWQQQGMAASRQRPLSKSAALMLPKRTGQR